jgi:hypothetical protein
MNHAIAVQVPVLIKARTEGSRRLVEVEASNETVDGEGDVILQSALLASAGSFIARGHLDIDHLSEIGGQLGIKNPAQYIVGRPTEVKDLGGGRTSVVGEISKATDGSHDPDNRRYDSFWDSLQATPATPWRASIYGYPNAGEIIDARVQKCAEVPGATRYVVKGIQWTSLAFTLHPVNDGLTGAARIVSAKALMKAYTQRGLQTAKASDAPIAAEPLCPYYLAPRNRVELLGHYYALMEKGLSPYAGGKGGRSVYQFRQHFEQCCMLPEWEADILANALANLIKREVRSE